VFPPSILRFVFTNITSCVALNFLLTMPPKQGQQPPPPLPPPPVGDKEKECVSNKEVHAMMKAMTKLFTKNQ
jgi:hypothetical protein